MKVTANIIFDQRFVVTNTGEAANLTGVILKYAKVNVDTDTSEANISGWIGDPIAMSKSDGVIAEINALYRAQLELDQSTYYLVEITAENASGTKTSQKFFINTADSATYYFAKIKVINNSTKGAVQAATVALTAPAALEFPKWLEELGQTEPDYSSAMALYTFLTTSVTSAVFSADTNANGEVLIKGLKEGQYDVSISKSGYTTIPDTITVSEDKNLTYSMSEI